MSIIWIFKPIGYTPKDCIIEYQKRTNINKKIAFAGRLDPMAYGLLPLIIHESDDATVVQKIKESLQGSYKTYQFKLILGLESDTFDILGLAKRRESINKLSLDNIKGRHIQSYPPYSSQKAYSKYYKKKVPLWKLAKEGRLPKTLPTREVDVEYIKFLDETKITNEELLEIIKIRFDALLEKTNYRNDEIAECWNNMLKFKEEFKVYHLEAKVSSGTYIRSIGNDLEGIVFDIYRISMADKVLEGDYDKMLFSSPV